MTAAALPAGHRRLARGNGDDPSQRRPGRPRTAAAIGKLVIRIATGNPTGGHRRGHGELARPGHRIAAAWMRFSAKAPSLGGLLNEYERAA